MSFILDALRKAENKNRSSHEMTVPQGPHISIDEEPVRPTSWGKIALIGIGGVALMAAGLLVGLSRNDAQLPAPSSNPSQNVLGATTQTTTTPATRTEYPAAVAATDQQSNKRPLRNTGARALDKEVQKGQPEPLTPPSTRTESTTVKRSADTQSASRSPVAPAPNAIPGGRVDTEVLPEYGSIVITGKVALPQLHLDMHVYSTQPQKRFVFVNLTKYQQGEEIDGNTTVESIRTDGVVIDHKGFRFILRAD